MYLCRTCVIPQKLLLIVKCVKGPRREKCPWPGLGEMGNRCLYYCCCLLSEAMPSGAGITAGTWVKIKWPIQKCNQYNIATHTQAHSNKHLHTSMYTNTCSIYFGMQAVDDKAIDRSSIACVQGTLRPGRHVPKKTHWRTFYIAIDPYIRTQNILIYTLGHRRHWSLHRDTEHTGRCTRTHWFSTPEHTVLYTKNTEYTDLYTRTHWSLHQNTLISNPGNTDLYTRTHWSLNQETLILYTRTQNTLISTPEHRTHWSLHQNTLFSTQRTENTLISTPEHTDLCYTTNKQKYIWVLVVCWTHTPTQAHMQMNTHE